MAQRVTVASFPATPYRIQYAGVSERGGPAAEVEATYGGRQRYVAEPQSVVHIPGRVILDTRFGSLLTQTGDGWAPLPGALYHPYMDGVENYLREANTRLAEEFERKRVTDLTVGPDGPVQFPLLSRWSRVYFHLLSECMVQLSELTKAYPVSRLRTITSGELSPVQKIALDEAGHLGIPVTAIRTRFAWVDNVAFYTGFHRHASINPCFIAAAEAIRDRFAGTARPAPSRMLYISRIAAAARPLKNEATLAERAVRLGYDVVDPGSMPFPDQVRLFAGARVIAGPHGAGLANAAFSNPGSMVVELRPMNRPGQSPMLNETYSRIAAARSLYYDFAIFANPPETAEWDIDLERATTILTRAAAWTPPAEG